jgi:cation diffusion facilitator CzcD-associated flavoprotein CzcO
MASEVDAQTANGTAQAQYDVDVAIIGAGPAGLTAGYHRRTPGLSL